MSRLFDVGDALMDMGRPHVLTSRDKDLTFRDMTVTLRAGGLHGYKNLMRALGQDPDVLLRKHGFASSALDDPDAPVSLAATLSLLEDSAVESGCPDLGLRLATLQSVDVLGTLSICIRNAPTVDAAIADAGRYLFLHSPAFQTGIDHDGSWMDDCVAIRFELNLPEFAPQRQTIDCCLAHMAQVAQLLGGSAFTLHGVSLPHRPLAPEDVYRRFFRAPVRFAEPHAALHISRDFLTHAVPAANTMVRQLALESIARRIGPDARRLPDRVRQTIGHVLGASRCTKSDIGGLLGMHPRTLQRRLAEEGRTFEELRDEVFKASALRFLRETDLPIKQIAGALAFSEQSAFTRSCKRWFGMSPARLRRHDAPIDG